jgi:hypothetical protein
MVELEVGLLVGKELLVLGLPKEHLVVEDLVGGLGHGVLR